MLSGLRISQMMNSYLFVLTLLAALGCAMMAGVFFAFSAFVMKALARFPAEQGVAAMQAINVAAVTFAFMTVLFGTALACGALAVWAILVWNERFAPYLLVGSALYLIGTILLTIAYHVPRNEALATVEPRGADAESPWRRYLSGWTAWNHVRAAAALAAAAVFTIALMSKRARWSWLESDAAMKMVKGAARRAPSDERLTDCSGI